VFQSEQGLNRRRQRADRLVHCGPVTRWFVPSLPTRSRPAGPPSHPQSHPLLQLWWKLAGEILAHLAGMVARAEMAGDNQFVLEPVGPLDEIIQVHVAELVNLLPAVSRPEEAQLRDQDLRLVRGREVVQPG